MYVSWEKWCSELQRAEMWYWILEMFRLVGKMKITDLTFYPCSSLSHFLIFWATGCMIVFWPLRSVDSLSKLIGDYILPHPPPPLSWSSQERSLRQVIVDDIVLIIQLCLPPQHVWLFSSPRHMERFQLLMKNSFLEHVFRIWVW